METKATTRNTADELAEHARSMKTLSNGSKIQHIGSCMALSDIDSNGMFTALDGTRHRASDFDWHNGRYQV